MTEKVTGIIFYRNYYDKNELIWIANKIYKVVEINLEQNFYLCESETKEMVGIDMSNKNRYALIYGK